MPAQKLFTNKERDEMLVFTSYLSNIINILKYSNLEALHQRHKELTEELYHKHQEINQYKESIRSFMRSNKERKIGILFYKHRKFTFANEAAQELIGIDLNANEGHASPKPVKSVARAYKNIKPHKLLLLVMLMALKSLLLAFQALKNMPLYYLFTTLKYLILLNLTLISLKILHRGIMYSILKLLNQASLLISLFPVLAKSSLTIKSISLLQH